MGRLELGHEVPVEITRLCSLGVDQQAATADLLSERQGSGDHVLEQPGSEASTLVIDIHTETGEQRDGLRVAAGALVARRDRGRRPSPPGCTPGPSGQPRHVRS